MWLWFGRLLEFFLLLLLLHGLVGVFLTILLARCDEGGMGRDVGDAISGRLTADRVQILRRNVGQKSIPLLVVSFFLFLLVDFALAVRYL